MYYAAYAKDSTATGAPPTPYKIVNVKSEPVALIVTTAASITQQEVTSFSYPTTHPVPSTFQNSIPGVTNTHSVTSTQPKLSDHPPLVSQFKPLSMSEATQLAQPGSDVPPQPTVSSAYQPSAPLL